MKDHLRRSSEKQISKRSHADSSRESSPDILEKRRQDGIRFRQRYEKRGEGEHTIRITDLQTGFHVIYDAQNKNCQVTDIKGNAIPVSDGSIRGEPKPYVAIHDKQRKSVTIYSTEKRGVTQIAHFENIDTYDTPSSTLKGIQSRSIQGRETQSESALKEPDKQKKTDNSQGKRAKVSNISTNREEIFYDQQQNDRLSDPRQHPRLPSLEQESYYHDLIPTNGDRNQCAIESLVIAHGSLPQDTLFHETVGAIEQELQQEQIRDLGQMINFGDEDGTATMAYLRSTNFLNDTRPIVVYSRHPQTGQLRQTRIGEGPGEPYYVFYQHEALHYWGLQGPLEDQSASENRSDSRTIKSTRQEESTQNIQKDSTFISKEKEVTDSSDSDKSYLSYDEDGTTIKIPISRGNINGLSRRIRQFKYNPENKGKSLKDDPVGNIIKDKSTEYLLNDEQLKNAQKHVTKYETDKKIAGQVNKSLKEGYSIHKIKKISNDNNRVKEKREKVRGGTATQKEREQVQNWNNVSNNYKKGKREKVREDTATQKEIEQVQNWNNVTNNYSKEKREKVREGTATQKEIEQVQNWNNLINNYKKEKRKRVREGTATQKEREQVQNWYNVANNYSKDIRKRVREGTATQKEIEKVKRWNNVANNYSKDIRKKVREGTATQKEREQVKRWNNAVNERRKERVMNKINNEISIRLEKVLKSSNDDQSTLQQHINHLQGQKEELEKRYTHIATTSNEEFVPMEEQHENLLQRREQLTITLNQYQNSDRLEYFRIESELTSVNREIQLHHELENFLSYLEEKHAIPSSDNEEDSQWWR